MARLIHLNGPSRVGKSTLAHRYAGNHPGTVCLDVDVLVGQVDGWREDFSAAFLVATARGLDGQGLAGGVGGQQHGMLWNIVV